MDQKTLKNSIFARMAGKKSNENNTSGYNDTNEFKMDSKQILNKIITMLGMENKQVELGGNANAGGPFYGKLEDGSPVVSDYFDVGHTLMLIKEDGSKVAAPDADHIIYLPIGLAGGFKRYFITTQDGIITSMNLEDNYNSKAIRVNFASENENDNQMKNIETTTEVELAEKTFDEKEAVKKEEKMQEGDSARLDSLESQVNQLRVDIAQLFEEMKKMMGEKKEDMAMVTKDEKEAVKRLQEKDQLQGMPNDGGPSKMNMSAQKKFTGAPVEQKQTLEGLVKSKQMGTMGTVLGRIANSKF
jgi:hypothetical protein